MVLIDISKSDKAEECFRGVPDEPTAKLLGKIAMDKGDIKEGIRLLNKTIDKTITNILEQN
jgi:hypothetical protein